MVLCLVESGSWCQVVGSLISKSAFTMPLSSNVRNVKKSHQMKNEADWRECKHVRDHRGKRKQMI